MIILDELSMVGGELFLKLIKAIPTVAKLIMLGDMGQLESIGCMNIAKDLYYSDSICTVELTKIHRQAQNSGIVTASDKIYKGKQLFSKGTTGKQVIGELKDMIFDLEQDKAKLGENVINTFKEYYNSDLVNKNINDIQILCPFRS